MVPKYNLFTKIVILLVIMLVPIIGLYFYSNKISTDVLGNELNKSNSNRLLFFQNQVNMNTDLLSIWPNLMMHDPDISNLKDIFTYRPNLDLDTINLIKRIQTKINIQESSSNWKSSLFIYSPVLKRVVSANDVRGYNPIDLNRRISPGWHIEKRQDKFIFSLVTASPLVNNPSHPEEVNLVIEVQFDSENIRDMLDRFKSDGRRDPFYYKKGTGVIPNRTMNQPLVNQLTGILDGQELKDIDNKTVDLNGHPYLVNIVKSNTIDWYLVDYIPLSHILLPIEQSNRLFYSSVGCLLLMSLIAAYLLYAQVQVPIRQLVQGFQKLKSADYAFRMTPKGSNEFSFVFHRFNSMMAQIQELFERVYLEKIHVREARLKQLQSQINPHFFYNCFSFISSMAKLQNHQAVIAMSQNLSKYYRYTTRQERDLVPLAEELEFVTHYLGIQKMRMKRIEVNLQIPSGINKLGIPPLVIQPLVENAVIHGIEFHSNAGRISISGEWVEEELHIIVEDDGNGLSDNELMALRQRLDKPMEEEMGCGLWNVQQRMQLRFGENAGLSFDHSPSGGLKVILKWSPPQV